MRSVTPPRLTCWVLAVACLAGGATLDAAHAAQPSDLGSRVDAIIAAAGPGVDVAVAFSTLDGTLRLLRNESAVFHAASTMKVPVMVELYTQAEAGTIRLDDPIPITNVFHSVVDGSVFQLDASDDSDGDLYRAMGSTRTARQLCDAMITKSSNLATNILIDRLGASRVATTMGTLGVPGMVVRRGVEDNKAFAQGLNNTTTALAFHDLLSRIGRHDAVSRVASDEMIAILSRQQFRAGIPAGLPAGTIVAHKTGTITRIHHDGGIVFGPQPYVLIVLTRGFTDEHASDRVISAISRVVYEATVSRPARPGR